MLSRRRRTLLASLGASVGWIVRALVLRWLKKHHIDIPEEKPNAQDLVS